MEEGNNGRVRLNKFIAGSGVCSRRKADELIFEGRVRVNGEVVTEPGFRADPITDTVELDGKNLGLKEKFIYIMLNKPAGCVTTASDQFGRKTVLDYIADLPTRVYPVGRLDYNTSGLLLLTNDGEFANKIIHPKNEIEKAYIVKVKGEPDAEDITKLRRGVKIEVDGSLVKTRPARVSVLELGKQWAMLEIVIHEGKNRQVRKMCEAVSLPIISLHRIRVGPLFLGDLKMGEYRFLTRAEVQKMERG